MWFWIGFGVGCVVTVAVMLVWAACVASARANRGV